ncbi:MAG: family 43 glycosylhydrolase [Acetatifactor sp.]|nr:family 43 glycosylhydrolase [Acetatifactor sp.]
MKPGFLLNFHDRSQNPLFESHDPSMMWDESSGFYYSYSTDSAITSPYRQGIPIRRSRDLVNFTFVGYGLSDAAVAQGRDNGDYPPTFGFWAPFVERRGDEYRMYYSATKAFGSSESRIWLAVSKSPEGPFENRGVVMDTWHTPDTDPNAIDPHVIDDDQERKYLVYGSFFGGIFIKELEPDTGLAKNPDVKFQGKCIAKRPLGSYIDGPEGAAIIYAPTTGYYYLFLSYGWLGDDYDIRVGRSKEVTGPYLDYEGKDLNGQGLGLKLAGSYRFLAARPFAREVSAEAPIQLVGHDRHSAPLSDPTWKFDGFRGPGHGVPFYDPVSDSFFFIHHVRDGAACFCRKDRGPLSRNSYRMHYMVVRRMYFVDGWPIFSPEPFAGEGPETVTLAQWEQTQVQRERTRTQREQAPTLREQTQVQLEQAQAQRGQTLAQRERTLAQLEQTQAQAQREQTLAQLEQTQAQPEHTSTWEWLEFLPDDNRIALSQEAPLPETINRNNTLVFSCYDFENSQETLALSGITADGHTIWGKRSISSPNQSIHHPHGQNTGAEFS